MGITLHWDDTNTIYQTFETDWTLKTYQHSMEALEVMVEGHNAPVRVIMDMSQSNTPSLRLTRGRRVDETRATRNVERIVLVSPGYFMPLVDCPVDTVDTLEEAQTLLERLPLPVPA